MSQQQRVGIPCPSCSPDLETEHEVLTTGGGTATVKCTDCGHVHKKPLESERTIERDVVVSQGGESFTTTVEVPADETVETGEEFIVETEEAIMQVRITDLQTDDETRAVRADAEDVETFWTRAVDNVEVDVTLHPQDGAHDQTRSITLHVPGDYEFTVGETHEFGEEAFSITGIHVRQDAIERYDFQKIGHDGDVAMAKDIKRVYGYDETSTAWSAW
ncbi:HVO_0476 family zinc finger protein [Salarchaeum japonicum]|uniref:HVO_0476 family zinc finger protein n=1 Tax=Salarchaeum japonicum TaxID=555573 RepID=UPI003C741F06